MIRGSRSVASLLIAAALGVSCIDTSGPRDIVCTPDDELAISVGPGLTPKISWTPDCTAFSLGILDSGALDQELAGWWTVVSKDISTSQIPPSLTYGMAPANTLQFLAASSLDTGRAYIVIVLARTSGSLIGQTSFRR